MAGRQRHELFRAPAVEVTVADQDRTNAWKNSTACAPPSSPILGAWYGLERAQPPNIKIDTS
jgi:hypothetical protein